MTKRKTDTLDKFITKYVQKFGVGRAINNEAREFAFYPKLNLITYSVYHSQADKMFAECINKKYNCDIRPFYFIYSLLHEIGHYKTLPTIPQKDLLEEMIIRDTILDSFELQEELNEFYTNLPSERAANEWAIEYLEKNTLQCWKFQKKVFARLAHYYKKWGNRVSNV